MFLLETLLYLFKCQLFCYIMQFIYTTIQKIEINIFIYCISKYFWKKSLVITKAAFILNADLRFRLILRLYSIAVLVWNIIIIENLLF